MTVHASIRGTGCSGGEFDLFSWQTALDGREIVEWIARQPWSNGKVGIYGHSYGGITGLMVAAAQPPHLVAVSVSGLIDDLYRGITYPGGVSNYGFPLVRTGVLRPVMELGGGVLPGVVNLDPIALRNLATRSRTVMNDPILQGLTSDTDNDWYRARSVITYVNRVRVPVHITGAYQDEQTGPRGPAHLWEKIPPGVPKRLLLTNGVHATQTDPPEIWQDRLAWMEHWLRGVDHGFGTLKQGKTSVTLLFEMYRSPSGLNSNGRLDARIFPLENTRWQHWYLREGGTLSVEAPGRWERPDRYLSGTLRQSWNFQLGPQVGPPLTTAGGPDEVEYRTAPFRQKMIVAGPITATLYVATTACDPGLSIPLGPFLDVLDTEFFVQLIDEGPDGSRSYLQRGMLRASHRAPDPAPSDYAVAQDGQRVIYRPYHPHTNPQPVAPGRVYEYVIEVFPLGHVFREGHRLVVKIHAPPLADSTYVYVPRRTPSLNTIYHDRSRPSRLLLPVVPLRGLRLGPELPGGSLEGIRYVAPGMSVPLLPRN